MTDTPPIQALSAEALSAEARSADTPPADTPPDRLSNNPASPFFDADALARGVGVRFKGAEKTNVEEYSLAEGWIRVQAGKTMDRKGQPLTIKLSGPVEVWFRDGDGNGGADAEVEAGSLAEDGDPAAA